VIYPCFLAFLSFATIALSCQAAYDYNRLAQQHAFTADIPGAKPLLDTLNAHYQMTTPHPSNVTKIPGFTPLGQSLHWTIGEITTQKDGEQTTWVIKTPKPNAVIPHHNKRLFLLPPAYVREALGIANNPNCCVRWLLKHAHFFHSNTQNLSRVALAEEISAVIQSERMQTVYVPQKYIFRIPQAHQQPLSDYTTAIICEKLEPSDSFPNALYPQFFKEITEIVKKTHLVNAHSSNFMCIRNPITGAPQFAFINTADMAEPKRMRTEERNFVLRPYYRWKLYHAKKAEAFGNVLRTIIRHTPYPRNLATREIQSAVLGMYAKHLLLFLAPEALFVTAAASTGIAALIHHKQIKKSVEREINRCLDEIVNEIFSNKVALQLMTEQGRDEQIRLIVAHTLEQVHPGEKRPEIIDAFIQLAFLELWPASADDADRIKSTAEHKAIIRKAWGTDKALLTKLKNGAHGAYTYLQSHLTKPEPAPVATPA
jgi:hypothetical protein